MRGGGLKRNTDISRDAVATGVILSVVPPVLCWVWQVDRTHGGEVMVNVTKMSIWAFIRLCYMSQSMESRIARRRSFGGSGSVLANLAARRCIFSSAWTSFAECLMV